MVAVPPFAEGLASLAELHRRTLPARLVVCVAAAGMFGAMFGWEAGLACFAVIAAAEGFGAAANRLDNLGAATLAYLRLSAMLATSLVWTVIAVIYWRWGGFAGQVTALVQLASLLIIAQNLSFKSLTAALAFGGLPAAALVAVPALLGGFHGAHLVSVSVSIALALLYLASDTRDNVVHARELREAQAALEAQTTRAEAANAAKSQFLAMMSHELRTPMNGVLGMARALSQSPLAGRQREQVEMLVRSGEGLMTILNDLLDLSKIEAGKLELEHTGFDLHDLAARTVALWSDAAGDKDVALALEIDPHVPRFVAGDPMRLRQILTNLISNALKFTAEGSVRLRLDNLTSLGQMACVEFAVIDTGIGMSADQQARVFEAFVQAEAGTARQFGGTGLGLSICRQFATLMGSEITAHSVQGEGSTFRFRLQLPIAEVAAADDGDETVFDLAGVKVLVADDNPINQAVARAIVEAFGGLVSGVEDGAQALQALKGGDFDVVLMDVHMPRMGGLEAIARIRAGEAGRTDQPVVALTADAMPGVDESLLAHGFDASATKPIVPQALMEAIVIARQRPSAAPGASAAA